MKPTNAYPSPMQLSPDELRGLPGPAHGDLRLPERFWAKTQIDTSTACWVWVAMKGAAGYGKFNVRTGMRSFSARLAHRFAYSTLISELPDYEPGGLQLDHLCRRRDCVNPSHLELVTPRENTARAAGIGGESSRARLLTGRCSRGHVDWEPQPVGAGLRCRACQRSRHATIRAAARSLGLTKREYARQFGWSRSVAEDLLARSETPS